MTATLDPELLADIRAQGKRDRENVRQWMSRQTPEGRALHAAFNRKYQRSEAARCRASTYRAAWLKTPKGRAYQERLNARKRAARRELAHGASEFSTAHSRRLASAHEQTRGAA